MLGLQWSKSCLRAHVWDGIQRLRACAVTDLAIVLSTEDPRQVDPFLSSLSLNSVYYPGEGLRFQCFDLFPSPFRKVNLSAAPSACIGNHSSDLIYPKLPPGKTGYRIRLTDHKDVLGCQSRGLCTQNRTSLGIRQQFLISQVKKTV